MRRVNGNKLLKVKGNFKKGLDAAVDFLLHNNYKENFNVYQCVVGLIPSLFFTCKFCLKYFFAIGIFHSAVSSNYSQNTTVSHRELIKSIE